MNRKLEKFLLLNISSSGKAGSKRKIVSLQYALAVLLETSLFS